MPVINKKKTNNIRTDIIADKITKTLEKKGQKVDRDRMRKLIRKLYEREQNARN